MGTALGSKGILFRATTTWKTVAALVVGMHILQKSIYSLDPAPIRDHDVSITA